MLTQKFNKEFLDEVNDRQVVASARQRVATATAQIVTDVKAASDLVSSIATASQEQAQGVEQINGAVGQMDKVTRRGMRPFRRRPA